MTFFFIYYFKVSWCIHVRLGYFDSHEFRGLEEFVTHSHVDRMEEENAIE